MHLLPVHLLVAFPQVSGGPEGGGDSTVLLCSSTPHVCTLCTAGDGIRQDRKAATPAARSTSCTRRVRGCGTARVGVLPPPTAATWHTAPIPSHPRDPVRPSRTGYELIWCHCVLIWSNISAKLYPPHSFLHSCPLYVPS